MEPDHRRWCATVYYDSPYLVLVLLQGATVLALERHRLAGGDGERLRCHVSRFVRDYTPDILIFEERAARRTGIAQGEPATQVLSIAETMERLLPGSDRATLADLCRYVLRRDPRLRRFVTVLGTGNIAMSKDWQAVTLLAVAVGLAGAQPIQ